MNEHKTPHPTISLIIPTYNRAETLRRTFAFLAKAEEGPEEVIVVDQSRDEAVAGEIRALCEGAPFAARYVFQAVASSTMARNRGMDEAGSDVLLFMDDDVDVAPGTFRQLRLLFADGQLALAGGLDKQTEYTNSPAGYFFGKSSWRKRGIGHVTSGMYGRFPLRCGEQTPTEWAMGFFFAVRRSCVERWRLRFDEHFSSYAYAEDLAFTAEFCRRARQEGLRCVMSSLLVVDHRYSQEFRVPSSRATLMMVLHRAYIRHRLFPGSLWRAVMVHWSNMGDFVLRLCRRQRPADVVRAELFYWRHHRSVLRGDFRYDEFLKKA